MAKKRDLKETSMELTRVNILLEFRDSLVEEKMQPPLLRAPHKGFASLSLRPKKNLKKLSCNWPICALYHKALIIKRPTVTRNLLRKLKSISLMIMNVFKKKAS